MLPIFHPGKHLIFRPLPVQFLIIDQMFKIFHRQINCGYDPKKALHEAYIRTHQTRRGIGTSIGATELYRQLSECLYTAKITIVDVKSIYLFPFERSLESHDGIRDNLDPIGLLSTAGKNPGDDASSRKKRLYFEARRQLGMALQLFAIEEADHKREVGNDLTQIDRLSQERLFLSETSRDLWVLGLQDMQREHKISNLFFFESKYHAEQFQKKTFFPDHVLPLIETLLCRVATIGQKTYIVYTHARAKEPFASLLKLERGGTLSDRRGIVYVIVGVEENGNLRLATREDAKQFHAHTRTILWELPLIRGRDMGKRNPDRDKDYWDCKLVGTYNREHPGFIVAGPVEQLVTTVEDYLNSKFARSMTNHDLYRGKQVDRFLCELWFPYTGDCYKTVKNFQSPHYGVDWGSTEVQNRLVRWRINKIQCA